MPEVQSGGREYRYEGRSALKFNPTQFAEDDNNDNLKYPSEIKEAFWLTPGVTGWVHWLTKKWNAIEKTLVSQQG